MRQTKAFWCMKLPTTLWHPFVLSATPLWLKTNLKSFLTKLNSRNKSFWMINLPAISWSSTRTKTHPPYAQKSFQLFFCSSLKRAKHYKARFLNRIWLKRPQLNLFYILKFPSWSMKRTHFEWKKKKSKQNKTFKDHQVVFYCFNAIITDFTTTKGTRWIIKI